MNLRFLTLVCWLLSATILFAQNSDEKIKLLDKDNSSPLTGASFIYGTQQGISNDEGIIQFSYSEGISMTLSHVNYGTWTLGPEEVLKAIQEKIYFRERITVNLYPVTIIAVRQLEKNRGDHLKIDYQQRLEHDGGDILNQIPAFSSIRKGGNYGFDPVFRGFKYDQLNVVLNGAQSATAACPNRMDPPTSQMAPNMMDRIEVLKGPYALRYGSGFGATINFIPVKLRFSEEPGFYGRVSTGYESNGSIMRGEGQAGFSGTIYDVSLFGSWSGGDDYTTGNGELIPAGFSRGSFGLNSGFRIAPGQEIRLSATYNRARDADFPALPMDLREDNTWMFNARHEIQIDAGKLRSWNTSLFGSFVDHLMDNRLKPMDPRSMIAETFATTYNYGGRTESIWQFGDNKLYAGADIRIEGAQGTRVREFLMGPNAGSIVEDNAWQDAMISKTALFAEYRVNTSFLNYVLSGRLELNHADINNPGQEFTEVYSNPASNQLNPGLSLGMLKDLSGKIRLGLWLGMAQRSGGLTERFINYFPVGQDPYEMLGNPRIKPEVNKQADLTFQWEPTSRTHIDIDIFGSLLKNYISSVIDTSLSPRLPKSPGVRQFVNIDEAVKAGFELSWTQGLIAGLQHQFSIAYTYAKDLERDEPLPEIAPLDLYYRLSGRYFQERFTPMLVFRFATEQSRISREFGETVTSSFALVDIKLGYSLSDHFSINAGIKNVFDENYYEHLSRSVRGTTNPIYAPGRNIFLNLNYVF